MAKENNEISDIVKKCKILLLDIEGTTTSISFVKDKLFPYAENNLKSFLESQWENEDVKEAVDALRKQVTEDQLLVGVEGVVVIPGEDATKDEQIEGVVNNVLWQMSADRKIGPLKQMQGLIWKLGYDKGEIKGHIYDDVYPALELWISTDGQKVYVYSSGSVQAQKLLFQKSLAGDMLPLIEGHFDTAVGAKQEPASYATIVEKIGCKPEEILFLTDIDKEAEAARASGLHAALVSREGNTPLTAEATAAFPVLHSFEQLASTNKRKPDPQVEEVPAKVPKTDIQDDVKTATETEPETVTANGSAKTTEVEAMETAAVTEKTEESETMEVEETPDATAVEAKDEGAVVETKTASAEAVDIAEKDEPMEDATVTKASAIDTKGESSVERRAVKVNSTEDAVDVKVDDNAVTAETSTDKETAVDVEAFVAENAKVQEAASEAPKVAKANNEKSVDNPADKVEAKTKMVDAATITENDKEPDVSKVVEKLAVETKRVDAATETTPVEEVAGKLKTIEAPADEETVNAPITIPQTVEIQTNKDKTEDASATDTISVKASNTEPKEVEANAETKKVEATSTSNALESNKIKDEAENKESTDESKPVKVAAVETSEANTMVAKNTDAKVKEILPSDSVEVETKPVGNGDIKATNKPVEIVAEAAAAVSDKPVEIAVEAAVEVSDQNDATEAPNAEPVVEEIEEKTEPNETEKMETEVKVTEVEVEMEPKEPAEKTQEDAITESSIEVQDITDDKQSLCEVTNIVDDVVPIVEEPTDLEEMEELQNAGDVLEKECDEILSKVQDVTNLDYIPVKPLHTIAEEMETDNIDSNDMVERILDSEMELSMKPDDIDLNAVQELAEPKLDADERIGKLEPATEKPTETPTVEDNTEEKMEVSNGTEMVVEKLNDNKVEITDEKMETEEVAEVETKTELENKVETEESIKPQEESIKSQKESTKPQEESTKPQEEISEPQESKKETEVPTVVEPIAKTNETEPECKETENKSVAITQDTKENNVSQEVQKNDTTETKVNGKANGDAITLNGDTSKDDDLKSRLTAENGKEKVNGSNGDSAVTEIGQGDNKVEAEIPDIKVKTVTTDKPIEQPVEA